MKRTTILFLSILLGIIALTGCPGSRSVRERADKRNLTYGMSVQAGDVLDPDTISILEDNFNLLVPENTMKWVNIRPTKGFWNWSDMDNMVAFAQKRKMRMKGHTFVWHQQNPPYVYSLKTREEAIALLTDQITSVMTRSKGKIYEYDVCNEVLNEDGTMRDTIWYKTIGPDYLDIAFRTARAADPDARLILNDYSNEYAGTPKADGFYALAKDLKDRGVPIDGVGLQMHLMAQDPVSEEALLENVRRFGDLGLFVSFTEIDVRVANPLTAEKEAEQIDAYSKLMEIALGEKNAGSFIMWGFSDKRSWIPRAFPGFGFAHLYDQNDKPKPVYFRLKDIISGKKAN